jgi:hypothetical protein
MVTFLENFVVWTEDAVQLCIAEWTPHTIHFFILWQFVLVLWLLQLCIFMLAVNYIRRQHTSINELQPVIHLIIKIGQDRRKILSECDSEKHKEFPFTQRVSWHRVTREITVWQQLWCHFTFYFSCVIRSHSHLLLSQ